MRADTLHLTSQDGNSQRSCHKPCDHQPRLQGACSPSGGVSGANSQRRFCHASSCSVFSASCGFFRFGYCQGLEWRRRYSAGEPGLALVTILSGKGSQSRQKLQLQRAVGFTSSTESSNSFHQKMVSFFFSALGCEKKLARPTLFQV